MWNGMYIPAQQGGAAFRHRRGRVAGTVDGEEEKGGARGIRVLEKANAGGQRGDAGVARGFECRAPPGFRAHVVTQRAPVALQRLDVFHDETIVPVAIGMRREVRRSIGAGRLNKGRQVRAGNERDEAQTVDAGVGLFDIHEIDEGAPCGAIDRIVSEQERAHGHQRFLVRMNATLNLPGDPGGPALEILVFAVHHLGLRHAPPDERGDAADDQHDPRSHRMLEGAHPFG